jgi:hypothetical protein
MLGRDEREHRKNMHITLYSMLVCSFDQPWRGNSPGVFTQPVNYARPGGLNVIVSGLSQALAAACMFAAQSVQFASLVRHG